jgi:hypothetical protein
MHCYPRRLGVGEMRHYNIYGDETTNPDEFIYCSKCKRERDFMWDYEQGECRWCGVPFESAEDFITGATMRKELEAINSVYDEWVALNRKATATGERGGE